MKRQLETVKPDEVPCLARRDLESIVFDILITKVEGEVITFFVVDQDEDFPDSAYETNRIYTRHVSYFRNSYFVSSITEEELVQYLLTVELV